MDKELIKDLIFYNLLELINNNYESSIDNEFVFEYSKNKENIIFKTIVENVYGGSCWSDSELKTEIKGIVNLDVYEIESLIEKLHYHPDYNTFTEDEIIDFYDKKQNFHFYTNIEEINEDYYCNHDKLRTIFIPIDEIAEYLMNFPYTKTKEDFLKSLEYLEIEKHEDLKIKLFADKLNNELSKKNVIKTKMKI